MVLVQDLQSDHLDSKILCCSCSRHLHQHLSPMRLVAQECVGHFAMDPNCLAGAKRLQQPQPIGLGHLQSRQD